MPFNIVIITTKCYRLNKIDVWILNKNYDVCVCVRVSMQCTVYTLLLHTIIYMLVWGFLVWNIWNTSWIAGTWNKFQNVLNLLFKDFKMQFYNVMFMNMSFIRHFLQFCIHTHIHIEYIFCGTPCNDTYVVLQNNISLFEIIQKCKFLIFY